MAQSRVEDCLGLRRESSFIAVDLCQPGRRAMGNADDGMGDE